MKYGAGDEHSGEPAGAPHIGKVVISEIFLMAILI